MERPRIGLHPEKDPSLSLLANGNRGRCRGASAGSGEATKGRRVAEAGLEQLPERPRERRRCTMAESDWDTVTVLRKKGPTAAQAKSKQVPGRHGATGPGGALAQVAGDEERGP